MISTSWRPWALAAVATVGLSFGPINAAHACGGFFDAACNLSHGGIEHGLGQAVTDAGNGLKATGKVLGSIHFQGSGGPAGGGGGMRSDDEDGGLSQSPARSLLNPQVIIPTKMPPTGDRWESRTPDCASGCCGMNCPSPVEENPAGDGPEKPIEAPIPTSGG
jgi:hypothetical protein